MRRRGENVDRPSRTAIYLNANPDTAPLALRANLDHNETVHESVVIVSVESLTVPHVQEAKRVKVDDLGYADDGICHVTLRFGFQDDIDVPSELHGCAVEQLEGKVDLENASYFISQDHDHGDARARHGALAQEAVRRHRPQRRQPGRATSSCPTSARS